MTYVFGTPLVVRIHGNLFLVVHRVHSNHSQHYSIVTWFYNEEIITDLKYAVHLETSRQFVALIFWVVCSVGVVSITTFVICANMSFL